MNITIPELSLVVLIGSGKVRDFALYGETTGETDQFGLPVRHNWAAAKRGHPGSVPG